jgi:hypothetical protein
MIEEILPGGVFCRVVADAVPAEIPGKNYHAGRRETADEFAAGRRRAWPLLAKCRTGSIRRVITAGQHGRLAWWAPSRTAPDIALRTGRSHDATA